MSKTDKPDDLERLEADIRGMTVLCYARGERIEQLEAALREIAYGEHWHGRPREIARRALEGKL